MIDNAIQEALTEIKRLNIKGKKVTPFLLDKINKITKGKSLASNVALIKNNARVSAKIAIELNKLMNSVSNSNKSDRYVVKEQVTVIGGINLDNIYKLEDEKTIHLKGVTQPTTFHQSCLTQASATNACPDYKDYAADLAPAISTSSHANDSRCDHCTDQARSRTKAREYTLRP